RVLCLTISEQSKIIRQALVLIDQFGTQTLVSSPLKILTTPVPRPASPHQSSIQGLNCILKKVTFQFIISPRITRIAGTVASEHGSGIQARHSGAQNPQVPKIKSKHPAFVLDNNLPFSHKRQTIG
ncbi:MAG: hypothetical protein KBA79_08090, partial [Candidatus Cloacimonetes bacterium]|nr:hypothetical protein [Candidatus Cloacimonadota bacterium]